MEKETVTKDIIKSELLRLERDSITGIFILLGLVFVLLFWFPMFLFKGMGVLVFFLLLLLIGFFCTLDHLKKMKKIRKNKFHIFSDKLMGYVEDITGDHSLLERDKKYALHFAGVNPYYLYVSGAYARRKNYYHWSETFAMTAEGVYNSSLVGDEFYIVSLDNKNADLFFNKKFFELK